MLVTLLGVVIVGFINLSMIIIGVFTIDVIIIGVIDDVVSVSDGFKLLIPISIFMFHVHVGANLVDCLFIVTFYDVTTT